MPNVKYTDSATFRCLENLKEGSLDISLIHTGKEHCPPGHICSMPRDEFIIHFVLDGTGFYSAGGQTWSLTPVPVNTLEIGLEKLWSVKMASFPIMT